MIWGNMFNRWPYTDLENLNLDWLIGVCKEITTNWPPKLEEIENEVNNKLDKALNEGTLGDILTNNGNGTYQWKPFDTAIANQIIQAVNNWLVAHPEATTTVQDGAITMPKLNNELQTIIKNLNSRPYKMGVAEPLRYNKSTIMGELSGDYSLQGCEYNPNRDRYVFCFSSETVDPIIIETDNEFNFIRYKAVPSGGHMNDITYNAQTDIYYVATTDSTVQLISIDGSTLETIGAVSLPNITGTVSRISYDSIKNCYYIYNTVANIGTYIYKLNSDFSEKELLMENFWNEATKNLFIETPSIYGQGSSVVNGRFVCLFWFGFEHDPGITRLVFMTEDNNSIDFFYDFQSLHMFDESETIINKDGVLLIPSYYSNYINISRVTINGVTDEELNTIYRTPLRKYTFTSETPTLLENLGLIPDDNSYYKCWITFNTNPANISGEQGMILGLGYGNNHGLQAIIEPSHIYYRKKINNEWYGWHDLLLLPRETTTSILTEALRAYTGGVQYLRYTGTDYSWLPFNDSNFRYALFKIEYCFSQIIVSVTDTTNNITARNIYVNNSWTGWYIEGIASHTSNILTIARTIKKGRYTIRYTGTDGSWLPNADTSFIYGLFDIVNISDSIIKVEATNYNGTKKAINMYVNNNWNGWKMYTAT